MVSAQMAAEHAKIRLVNAYWLRVLYHHENSGGNPKRGTPIRNCYWENTAVIDPEVPHEAETKP
jgi:hypothetical protein